MDDPQDLLDPHALAEAGLNQWQESTAVQASLNKVQGGDLIQGKYQVRQVLGAERYQVVHLGTQKNFELRRVATLVEGSRAWRRLEIITSAASVVANEHLGFVADFGMCHTFGGFVVGEWVDGTLLTSILAEYRQLELEEVLTFVLEIGNALQTLHDLGLAHGLLDSDDVILGKDGIWRLLFPGAPPAKMNIGKAPELENFYAATAASDQFAFAYVTWSLLVGAVPDIPVSFGPSELRVDTPESMDAAILKALSPNPKDRWSSLDFLQEKIQSEVGAWRSPVIDSFDATEASRLLRMHPGTGEEKAFKREGTDFRSVVIRFTSQKGSALALDFAFTKIGRLRREYRRNIVTGSLFVPTPLSIEVGTAVVVNMSYQPTDQSVKLNGRVSLVTKGDENRPPGIGVSLDKPSHQLAIKFVQDIDPFSRITPDSVIQTRTDFDPNSSLTGTEAFLLGRLSHPMPLGQLRGLFAGMPFDVDEVVLGLIEAGFVDVRDVEVLEKREHTGRVSRRITTIKYSDIATAQLEDEEVDQIIERVRDFQQSGNFRAASELIESTLKAHEDHRLLFQLATIEGRFQRAFARALQHVERALELDPGNVEYEGLKRWLKSIHNREATSNIYRSTVAGARFRFVCHSDANVWIEVLREDPSKRRLVRIDVTDGILKETRKISGEVSANVALLPTKQGGPVPRFYAGPPPISTSPDAHFMVSEVDGDGKGGLFLAKAGWRNFHSVLPKGVEGVRPALAPDSSGAVAWISTGKTAGLYLTEFEQNSRKSVDLNSLAFAVWSADSSMVYVVEETSGSIKAVDRKTLACLGIGKIAPGVQALSVDGEHRTAVAASSLPSGTYELTWFELDTARVLGSMQIKTAPLSLIARGDGKAAIRLRDSVLLLDIARQIPTTLDLTAGPETFEFGQWKMDAPLFLVSSTPNVLDLVRVDPSRLGG